MATPGGSEDSEEPSILQWLGENVSDSCGYCKTSTPDKFTHGMWAHGLAPRDYQDLIDRGWRRSGQYCYKPTMATTCCPQYTIRLDAPAFRPTASQKRAARRLNAFLKDGTRPRPDKVAGDKGKSPDSDSKAPSDSADAKQKDEKEKMAKKTSEKAEESSPKPRAERDRPVLSRRERRRERKLQALQDKGLGEESLSFRRKEPPREKTLEERLELPADPKHRLEGLARKKGAFELRLVWASDECAEWKESFAASHGVYHAYQTGVHGDPPAKPSQRQFRRFLADSPLHLRLRRVGDVEEAAEAALFAAYQMAVHGDPPNECDQEQFQHFLVKSPLHKVESGTPGQPGWGSFHQQYWLDGELVAVGVLDLLPRCVSSVYLFYKPDFAFLRLGTYSALQEIALSRLLHDTEDQMRWYYMGYYIHDCGKMRYKGDFGPSWLACPETFAWVPIEECRPKLDAAKYARLDPDPDASDQREGAKEQTIVLYRNRALEFRTAKMMGVAVKEAEVAEFARLVGKDVVKRALLVHQ